ncbi:MAG: riboflavin synthase [Chitinophagales bacterium]
MFTGIVERLVRIQQIESSGTNIHLWIDCDIITDLSIDQSIAHNGICLTIDQIKETSYRVTAIDETIQKTSISQFKSGQFLNFERCLTLSKLIDGHIVQGHVDSTAIVKLVENKNGSWNYVIQYPENYKALIIEKGSIAVDGISLTCHGLSDNLFTVSIIPYTYEHTVAQYWRLGSIVNLEFDIVGKYLLRQRQISA